MGRVWGIISDRILRGDIPSEALSRKRLETDDRPHPEAVKRASGRSLGKGHKRDGTKGQGLRE